MSAGALSVLYNSLIEFITRLNIKLGERALAFRGVWDVGPAGTVDGESVRIVACGLAGSSLAGYG